MADAPDFFEHFRHGCLPSADSKSKPGDMCVRFCAISSEIASLRVGTAGRQVYLPTSDGAQFLAKVVCHFHDVYFTTPFLRMMLAYSALSLVAMQA